MARTGPDYRLALCIATYRRARLLCGLLAEVAQQTVQPDVLVTVDGDPCSGEVCRALGGIPLPREWKIIYVPSNHANLAYQRYLGWRAAQGCQWLLYLDDDLRLRRRDALEKVLAPLGWEGRNVVAVTAEVEAPEPWQGRDGRPSGLAAWLVERLGSGRRVQPGGLTASGHRRAPVRRGQDYERVEWLRGGVMGFRASALDQECFSDSLFALTSVKCGLGEDTFLGRRLCSKGEIVLAFGAGIEHPDADSPKAYPSDAYGFGRAVAYSRRFLNDHYRGFDPPRLSDRAALVKSYAGNLLLAWLRGVRSFRRDDWRYAWGYTVGVGLGLTRAPTARKLTPHIDWWGDAEKALGQAVVFGGSTG